MASGSDPFEVLLDTTRIQSGVRGLAAEISRDQEGRPFVLAGMLPSALMFLADLARGITGPVIVDSVVVQGVPGAGTPRLAKDLDHDIRDQDVVVVAAVVDTGRTLAMVLETLRSRSPRSLRSCALLLTRQDRAAGLRVEYVAFEVPPAVMVGYGLDASERYRQLPVVGRLQAASAR